jgi:alpha-L-fucosidase
MMMKRFLIIFFLFDLCACFAQSTGLVLPKENQVEWQNAEIGALFSYDIHVFDGKRYVQSTNRITPPVNYNIFYPKSLDTDQWVLAAKSAGCKFAMITATHETGFGLWQSDYNPFCMKCLQWKDGKGDIIRDFVNSCRKYGVKPGIYIGIRWNAFLGIHNFKVDGNGPFAKNRQQWYKKYCESIVKELCTKYGKLFLVWFDGGADDPNGLGPDVEPIIKEYQPNCLFYHNVNRADIRWGGSESGSVPYPCWSTFPTCFSHGNQTEFVKDYQNILSHGTPDGKYWMPAMADFPLRGYHHRHEWFWEPDDDNAVFPVTDLLAKYEESVGRNATMVIGLTPDTAGLIPECDVKRLKEFGDSIQYRFSHPIAKSENCHIKMKKDETINCYLLQEDIRQGQRVQRYTLQAKVGGRWRTIDEGSCIGHKRINRIPVIKTHELRLIVSEKIAKPLITNFSVYNLSKNDEE